MAHNQWQVHGLRIVGTCLTSVVGMACDNLKEGRFLLLCPGGAGAATEGGGPSQNNTDGPVPPVISF